VVLDQSDFGNYTLDPAVSIASGLYGYQPFAAFYLAKGNQVIVEDMKHLTVQGSGKNTSAGGHNYPDQLKFNWQNGSDTVRLTLSVPKLISSGSSTADTNSSVIGHPKYMRISGNGELNVNCWYKRNRKRSDNMGGQLRTLVNFSLPFF